MRAVMHVDTDEGTFVGEALVRMAALQRFLSKRADTSGDGGEGPPSPRQQRDPQDGANRSGADQGTPSGSGSGGGRDRGGGGGARPPDGENASIAAGRGPSSANDGPVANEDGTIRGAAPSYGQEGPRGLDSGVAYRDKNWKELVRRPDAKIGPPQVSNISHPLRTAFNNVLTSTPRPLLLNSCDNCATRTC